MTDDTPLARPSPPLCPVTFGELERCGEVVVLPFEEIDQVAVALVGWQGALFAGCDVTLGVVDLDACPVS